MTLETLKNRIRAAESSGYTAEATELMEAYLRRDPLNMFVALSYGENLRVLGRLGQAERFLSSLDAERVPQKRRYYFHLNLAQLYESRMEFDHAAKSYEACAASHPDSTIPWVFWGAFLSRTGRIGEAISILTRGLLAQGDLDEVHLNIGHCYRAMADYGKARTHYSAAIEISPDYDEAVSALSDVIAAAAVHDEVEQENGSPPPLPPGTDNGEIQKP